MASSPADTPHRNWLRWLPGLAVLKTYQAAWLPRDLAAGLVLTAMLVPVGIAYAEASGVPGVYGLYATIVPLLAYALFGPSRILVLGPDSALAAPILAVVLSVSEGDPMRAVATASLMAIVSGLFCIILGLLRLGFITELLSKPIRYGYMNGIALVVLASQLPKLSPSPPTTAARCANSGSSRRPCSTARPTDTALRWEARPWSSSCCSSASSACPAS
ncbi:sulfate transporter N-terminal domain protein [Bordetella bronchiseptica SBL-F6116]|nr:sulfate transporter N-terminal domain protein [Bordetella bronchiseptica SBL-F6116]